MPHIKVQLADAHVYCPRCAYNLTGVAAPRCPECGNDFDPASLRRRASWRVQQSTPWDSWGGIRGYLQTWALAALQPRQLAEFFPRRHSVDHAQAYTVISCGLAVAALLASVLVPATLQSATTRYAPPMSALDIALFIGVAACCAAVLTMTVWVCEMLIAVLISRIVQPRDPANRYRYWRGLVHYLSGFAPLSALWLSCGVIVTTLIGPVRQWDIVCWSVGGIVLFGWWSLALAVMIVQVSLPGVRRWLACAAAPFVGVIPIATLLVVTGTARSIGRWMALF